MPIVTSYVQPTAGGAIEQQIKRGIAFNVGSGHVDQHEIQHWENRTEGTFGNKGVPVFSDSGHTPWSVPDMLDYLLAYFQPANKAGTVLVPFAIDPAGQLDRLATLQPKLHYHGLTLKQILDHLVSRFRLAGYRIRVDETQTPNVALIRVFTYADQDLKLPSGSTIQASPDQILAGLRRRVRHPRVALGGE